MQECDIANSCAHATQHSHGDSRPLPWTCGQLTGALACRASNRWRRVRTAVKEMSTSQRGLCQQTQVCQCGMCVRAAWHTADSHAACVLESAAATNLPETHGM